MGNKSMIFEILKRIIECYEEIFSIKLDISFYKQEIKVVFGNDKDMINLLEKETDKYLDSIYNELGILKFVLKNEKKLYVSDICRLFDMLDEDFKDRYYYKEALFNNLDISLGAELDYKFYSPNMKIRYITQEVAEKYISYVRGFNEDRIKDFLLGEQVLTEEELVSILNNAKILNVSVEENEDLFGVFDKAFVLPKVVDEKSSLIYLHEIIQKVLELKTNLVDDDIKYGEELPIFYELLLKKYNDFISMKIHSLDSSEKLLEDYHFEPFEEQIQKLSRIKKSQ